ncbi:MAG: hypothetical protein HOM21_03645, partial [Halobacteriovoraceae bacterium]|nr:hypothetical protein [Halobacteriovoraceae bacterium]
RHQKIIEECPSPAIDSKIRSKICQTAVDIAKSINYVGAGTVEFMLEESGDFYFLEMNTRLQVEHPVTEMVTGTDLVKWQIQIAENKKLPLTQSELRSRGHAIECRLYAEDPDHEFLPSIGRIEYVGTPQTRDSRLDTGYVDGNSVSINFDPMLAKLVVWGENREEAIAKLKESLAEVPFFGIKTNGNYLSRIIKHPQFIKGETYTHFVETHKNELGPLEPTESEVAVSIAAYLLSGKKSFTGTVNTSSADQSPWDQLIDFRNV